MGTLLPLVPPPAQRPHTLLYAQHRDSRLVLAGLRPGVRVEATGVGCVLVPGELVDGRMSVHVSSAVWKSSTAKGNALLVQLALADQANDDGWCWPGQATLAGRTRLGRATVQRQLRSLSESGEIEVHPREGSSNVYRVTPGGGVGYAQEVLPIDGVPHSDAPQTEAGEGVVEGPQNEAGVPHSCDAGGCLTGDAGGASPVMHITVNETSVETSLNPGAPPVGGCPETGCDKPEGHSGPRRNPWWDAIVEALGYQASKKQESRFGELARRARDRGDPPGRIVEAAQWIAREWGPSKLTLNSLSEHYERATSDLARLTAGDAEQARRSEADDQARREILDARRRAG